MTDLTGKIMATDNCDKAPNVTQNLAVGELMSPGMYDITLTATDTSGNIGTKTCPAAFHVNRPPV
jgi:hypothetical protein